jgi:RNA polymerase-binding transcription factor DksA
MTDSTHEHHPDPIDRASALELATTEDAIRVVQARNVQKQKPGADGEYPEPDCIECGNEIGIGRLRVAANNVMCIHCATIAERWRR